MKTMRSTPSVQTKPAPHAGFTLTELLAIVGILAVLACLQLPALAWATGQSKRTQCAANLRQFALALHVYGADYSDQLPSSSAGSWAWDLPWNTGVTLTRYGAGWKVMFCPGTAPRFNDANNYQLYSYVPGAYHVLGYALTFPNTAAVASTNWNNTLTPQATTSPNAPPPLPAKRVLVADATISAPGQYSTSPSTQATYNWTAIAGGYFKRHLSPHLVGTMPVGGNTAMLDGHVEWHTFSVMAPRTGNTGSPVFWW